MKCERRQPTRAERKSITGGRAVVKVPRKAIGHKEVGRRRKNGDGGSKAGHGLVGDDDRTDQSGGNDSFSSTGGRAWTS